MNKGKSSSYYMRQPEVLKKLGISSSTIWRLEKAGKFPPRRQLSSNSVGWLNTEIEKWMNNRPTAQ